MIWAATDAAIGNYVLDPWFQPQFQPGSQPISELIGVETALGVMSEVAGTDYTVTRAGIVVGNGVLVSKVTNGAVIVLITIGGYAIYLPDKPLNSVMTEAFSYTPHIKHLPTR